MPWILGRIAKVVTRLHYQYEVKPFAEKLGLDRDKMRGLCAIAVQSVFDKAWPREARDDKEGRDGSS